MQVFHPFDPVECRLGGGIAGPLQRGPTWYVALSLHDFREQSGLVKSAATLPGRMKRHRNEKIKRNIAQALVVECCIQPLSHQVAKINLLAVLKIVDDATNDAAASIGR